MVSIKSFDLKAVLLASVVNALFLFYLIMMLLTNNNRVQNTIACVAVLTIIALCTVIQVTILLTAKKLTIDSCGITVYEKSGKKVILWNEVKLFTYYSEIILLEPNTLKVIYGNNEMLLGTNYSYIHISLQKYKEAISFIPEEIIKNNSLFLYETMYLYEQDKYGLYK